MTPIALSKQLFRNPFPEDFPDGERKGDVVLRHAVSVVRQRPLDKLGVTDKEEARRGGPPRPTGRRLKPATTRPTDGGHRPPLQMVDGSN